MLPPPQGMAQGPMQGQGMPETMPQDIVTEVVQEQPELLEELYRATVQGIADGEIGPSDVQQVGQMALATLSEPSMYPELVQMAAQSGVLPGMPEQPDPMLLGALAAVGARIGQDVSGPGQGQQEPGIPSLATGGYIPTTLPGGEMKARIHAGEYVLPPDVVQHFGVDKIDKMVDAARKQPQEKMAKELTDVAHSPRELGLPGKSDGQVMPDSYYTQGLGDGGYSLVLPDPQAPRQTGGTGSPPGGSGGGTGGGIDDEYCRQNPDDPACGGGTGGG